SDEKCGGGADEKRTKDERCKNATDVRTPDRTASSRASATGGSVLADSPFLRGDAEPERRGVRELECIACGLTGRDHIASPVRVDPHRADRRPRAEVEAGVKHSGRLANGIEPFDRSNRADRQDARSCREESNRHRP